MMGAITSEGFFPISASIAKRFDTLRQAERFQNRLYGKYDRVTLVSSPRFGESGLYVWSIGKAVPQ